MRKSFIYKIIDASRQDVSQYEYIYINLLTTAIANGLAHACVYTSDKLIPNFLPIPVLEINRVQIPILKINRVAIDTWP